MPSVSEVTQICDIPVELNSIKESLSKIPDTALALDILTSLEKVGQQIQQQDDIYSKMQEEAKRIQSTNNALMIRATAQNSILPPTSTVNYNNIDGLQSIIDKV